MRGLPRIDVRSARRSRLGARAPRLALIGVCGVLCLAGLRVVIAGPANAETASGPDATVVSQELTQVRGVAEAFTRAYFTWDHNHPDARAAALSPLVADAIAPDAGFSPPTETDQTVTWTATVAERTDPDAKVRYVTVAAATGRPGLVYLEVPVRRDPQGRIAVTDFPAVVGGPPRLADGVRPGAAANGVSDAELAAVVRRAATNYLKGDAEDLRADLARGAVVSLPELRVNDAEPGALTWLDQPNGLVAVEVDLPNGGGGSLRLVYRLSVTRSDRWYVRAINTNSTTTTTGATPTQP